MTRGVSTVFIVILILFASSVRAQLFRPYKCGPVLKEKNLQTFDSLNQYLGIKPGITFAEVGSSSGYYNGAMSVFLDSVTFYLQDIDSACLNQNNLNRVLKYYSRFRDSPVTQTNKFHIVIGTETKTCLPENSIDIIYSNATYHVLNYPDSILKDLNRALKDDGTLTIRDEFVFDGKDRQCKSTDCSRPLVHYEDFVATMEKSGFELIDETDQFGYPAYKFKKSD